MITIETFFYFYATVAVIGAVGVIGARNPVHSVLFLILTFLASACLWVLIQAEFLGIVLVLVYVGAVMVLFLFVVMMLDIKTETMRTNMVRYATLGLLVGMTLFATLIGILTAGFAHPNHAAGGWFTKAEEGYSNTRALGQAIYSEYVYALEIAGIILLVAIIVAITLTHRQRSGLKTQNIAKQVSVQAKDRLKIIKDSGAGHANP